MNDSLLHRLALDLVGPPMERDDVRLATAVAGKVVLVTGASFGQGEATARLFAHAGAHVVLVARTADRLAEIASEIAAAGGRADTFAVDMSDLPAVDRLAVDIGERYGRVDVLIHNAGKSLRRSVYRSAQRMQDMDAMVGVNFLGPMRLTLGLLPLLRENGDTHIVNVATAGLWMTPAAPRWAFYLACKAGFDTWIRSVALETSNAGITLTSLYAGHIKSRMVATGWVKRTPGHTPEQAARIVAYAVTRRPRVMAPRMMGLARLGGVATEPILGPILSWMDGRAEETPASDTAFAAAMAKLAAAGDTEGRR